jgi:hypothetical protein
MYYIEVLRTWRVFRTYLFVLAGLYVFVAALFAIWPHGEPRDEGTLYSVGGHAVIVGFICLLFASIIGSSLSRHLDHLDFALTKPRSRADFVATVLGIDFLGLTVFFLTTALALAALHIGLGFIHGIAFDASSSFGIAIAFGSVLAWYALVQAVSCAREARGWAVAGVWVTALSLYFLSFLSLETVGPGFHALIAALNFINPIANLSIVPFVATSGAASLSLAAHAFAIYVVAGVAALIALIRWQRVEA